MSVKNVGHFDPRVKRHSVDRQWQEMECWAGKLHEGVVGTHVGITVLQTLSFAWPILCIS